jgi:hypothetical protein
MLNFGILLKSYDKDFDLAERLIASFNENNPESLHLFVVVPQQDVSLFEQLSSTTISVLSESLMSEYLVEHEVAGIRPGYINQEIVKLAFWELGLCENYFCVDSDAVFIRPLSRDDFMYDETTPYTVLVEDNELKSEPKYYEQHWKGREPQLRRIQELVGLKDRRILTCHGHQVFSSKALQSLKYDFMQPREWSYKHVLEASPYEFSWYNFWVQKSGIIPIMVREPLVKTVHNELQLLSLSLQGIQVEDLQRAYIGVVLNSNFSTNPRRPTIHDTVSRVLADTVRPKVLASALLAQGRRRLHLLR